MKTKVAIVALGIATVVPWTVGEKAIFLVVIAVAYVIAEGLIRLWAIRRDAKLAREYKIEIEEQMKIKDWIRRKLRLSGRYPCKRQRCSCSCYGSLRGSSLL